MSSAAPPPGPDGPTAATADGAPGTDAPADPGTTASAVLAGATAALRSHTDQGWQQVRPGLLTTALSAFRPSDPARGRHDLGTFWVSSDVVVERLGRVVEAVPGARPQRITCVTGDFDALERVDAQIAADYGSGLQAVAADVRRAVEAELRTVLGDPVDDAGAPLPVAAVNVHVVDITWDSAGVAT